MLVRASCAERTETIREEVTAPTMDDADEERSTHRHVRSVDESQLCCDAASSCDSWQTDQIAL
jgi:hypothetical protein